MHQAQQHNRQVRRRHALAEAFRQVAAVRLRQGPVHEQQVVRRRRVDGPPGRRRCAHRRRVHPPLFHLLPEQRAGHLVVVHNEHGAPLQRGLLSLQFQVVGLVVGLAHPERKVERRPHAHLALNPHLAPHGLDNLLRDGEAQPRPAVFALARGIHLAERRKQLILLIFGNANARVLDAKVQLTGLHQLLVGGGNHVVPDAAQARAVGGQLDPKRHLALVGKLDGVGEQVQ